MVFARSTATTPRRSSKAGKAAQLQLERTPRVGGFSTARRGYHHRHTDAYPPRDPFNLHGLVDLLPAGVDRLGRLFL